MSNSLQLHELQHARPPCPSPTPGDYPNSCPLSRWCHPTISSSVVPFSSCPQSFPVSGSFQMSQFFASGGQSIGVSASTSVLPMNTQDWSPLGHTGWISLQSKGLSRVFSNTTVQKHQFFSTAAASKSLLSCPTLWPHPWDSPGKNTGVDCHFLLQCRKVKSECEVAQSCPTLRNPMDCSLPGSSVHGIFQARVLEWDAIAFSVFGAKLSL